MLKIKEMNTTYIFLIFLLCFSFSEIEGKSIVLADGLSVRRTNYDTCKCNYNCWPDLNDSTMVLSIQQIYRFLTTIGFECENNAEFSEFSNEMLFKIMELNPNNFLVCLDSYNKELEMDHLLNEIKMPVNDGIDIQGIYYKIQMVNITSKWKGKILEALRFTINLNK